MQQKVNFFTGIKIINKRRKYNRKLVYLKKFKLLFFIIKILLHN